MYVWVYHEINIGLDIEGVGNVVLLSYELASNGVERRQRALTRA